MRLVLDRSSTTRIECPIVTTAWAKEENGLEGIGSLTERGKTGESFYLEGYVSTPLPLERSKGTGLWIAPYYSIRGDQTLGNWLSHALFHLFPSYIDSRGGTSIYSPISNKQESGDQTLLLGNGSPIQGNGVSIAHFNQREPICPLFLSRGEDQTLQHTRVWFSYIPGFRLENLRLGRMIPRKNFYQ